MIFTFKKNPSPNVKPLLLYLELPIPTIKKLKIEKSELDKNSPEMIIIQVT